MTTSDTEATARPMRLAEKLANAKTPYATIVGGIHRLDLTNDEYEAAVAAVNDRDALLAQVAVMREALEPFAKMADQADEMERVAASVGAKAFDNKAFEGLVTLFREARAALSHFTGAA